MKRAVNRKHSVHYVTVSGTGHGQKVRMVCDVGRGVGIQRIKITRNGRTGPASVIVARRTAYLKGTAYTMRVYFGFSKAQAKKYAGKWISIPHTNPGFATVSADATFRSFVVYLFPHNKLSLVSRGKLVGVRGTATVQGTTIVETVYAPRHGKPLPTKEATSEPGHPGKGVMTMSGWNEAVHVSAPKHAVPISKVVGG